MRKKIPEEDKKKTISVSMHPELKELLEKYSEEIGKNKSVIVEDLLKKYLDKDKR